MTAKKRTTAALRREAVGPELGRPGPWWSNPRSVRPDHAIPAALRRRLGQFGQGRGCRNWPGSMEPVGVDR